MNRNRTTIRYCMSCGERWSLDADKHQMRCDARALLLSGDASKAADYCGSMQNAPEPSNSARQSTRGTKASRAYQCAACKRPWSVYASNHADGCPARPMLARGAQGDAVQRWRIRPGELPRPAAAPSLVARFRIGGAR